MKPQPLPLRTRIISALRLSSMTCLDLAWCLSSTPEYVGQVLLELQSKGEVVAVGHKPCRGVGRPWTVWGIAA